MNQEELRIKQAAFEGNRQFFTGTVFYWLWHFYNSSLSCFLWFFVEKHNIRGDI